MNAHLGDFGIANLIVHSRSIAVGHSGCKDSLVVTGTIGYMAPGKRPTDSMFEGGCSSINFCGEIFQIR